MMLRPIYHETERTEKDEVMAYVKVFSMAEGKKTK
jgi:hypothetical protein